MGRQYTAISFDQENNHIQCNNPEVANVLGLTVQLLSFLGEAFDEPPQDGKRARFSRRRTLHLLAGVHLLPRSYIWGLADTIRTGMEGRGPRSMQLLPGSNRLSCRWSTRAPVRCHSVANAQVTVQVVAWSAVLQPPCSWLRWRAAPHAGMRHALPVLVVLGVFGGTRSNVRVIETVAACAVMVVWQS